MADAPTPPARRPDPRKLGTWNRALCDVLGLAGLGSGGIAVFTTDQEAGPVALIAAGVILLMIGMGGRLPNRLKFGDNEAEWVAAGEILAEAVENAPPDAKANLLSAVNTLSETMPQVSQASLQAIAYEAVVFNMLAEIVENDKQLVLAVPKDTRRFGFDAQLLGPTRKLLVEIKAVRVLTFEIIERINDKFQLINDHGAENVLVVVRADLSETMRKTMQKTFPALRPVQIRGPEDMDKLHHVIRDLIVID